MNVDSTTPADVFIRDIAPALFGADVASENPTLVFLAGQPGAGRSRLVHGLLRGDQGDVATVSVDDLAAFHPDFLELTRWRPLDAPSAMSPIVVEWLSHSIEHAISTRRSLLLEATVNNPETAFGTAAAFADVGFTTRIVVVAARRSESLLTTASRFFNARRAMLPARFTDRGVHDRGWVGTHALVREAEASARVDRLTILSRDGSTIFDARSDDGFSGATAAFEAVQAVPMTMVSAAEWFGELRRVTEYARQTRELSVPVAEVLVELHELALNEVLPLTPVRRRSSFAVEQEARLSRDLVELRRAAQIERSAPEPTAPAYVPPVPERSGPSL